MEVIIRGNYCVGKGVFRGKTDTSGLCPFFIYVRQFSAIYSGFLCLVAGCLVSGFPSTNYEIIYLLWISLVYSFPRHKQINIFLAKVLILQAFLSVKF